MLWNVLLQSRSLVKASMVLTTISSFQLSASAFRFSFPVSISAFCFLLFHSPDALDWDSHFLQSFDDIMNCVILCGYTTWHTAEQYSFSPHASHVLSQWCSVLVFLTVNIATYTRLEPVFFVVWLWWTAIASHSCLQPEGVGVEPGNLSIYGIINSHKSAKFTALMQRKTCYQKHMWIAVHPGALVSCVANKRAWLVCI